MALILCQVFGYIYNSVKYILIQTIQTYTYTYIQIHVYTCNTCIYRHMHVPITVRRGLWGAVADAICLRE